MGERGQSIYTKTVKSFTTIYNHLKSFTIIYNHPNYKWIINMNGFVNYKWIINNL